MTSPLEFAHQPLDTSVEAVSADWQRLVQAMPQAMPFQTPAWVSAYARHWPREGATLHLVTARRDGRLVAVLPLAFESRRVGPLSLRVATPIYNPHMPLTDLTVDPAETGVVPALVDWLLRRSGLGIARLDLPGVAQDAAFGHWLTQATTLPRRRSLRTSEAARIDTRMDYDTLLKGVSSKHRSNLSRSTKRAEAIGPLRYEVYQGEALISQGWPLLLEIEASGWKGRAGTAIGNDAMLAAFYQDAARGLESAGLAHIGILWFGDRPAAAVLLLVAGRVAYTHKVGYREEWSAMGPGHLLVREVVQRACADPALDAVSLVLHPPWSDVWRPTLTPVEHHSLFSAGWQGQLLWQLTRLRDRRAAAPAAVAASAPEETDATGQP